MPVLPCPLHLIELKQFHDFEHPERDAVDGGSTRPFRFVAFALFTGTFIGNILQAASPAELGFLLSKRHRQP